MLVECWTSVADGGPTLNQHWFNVSCLLGRTLRCQGGCTNGLWYSIPVQSYHKYTMLRLLVILTLKVLNKILLNQEKKGFLSPAHEIGYCHHHVWSCSHASVCLYFVSGWYLETFNRIAFILLLYWWPRGYVLFTLNIVSPTVICFIKSLFVSCIFDIHDIIMLIKVWVTSKYLQFYWR